MLPPANQNYGQIGIIEMGPEYADQFFYSLATNTVIKHNSRFAYDLMFDCDAGKFNIWLNTGKHMSVKRTGKTNLDSVSINDTLNGQWHYELGAFNSDSNAIGQWWTALTTEPASAGEIYILQLGYDNEGNGLGYIKLRVNNYYGSTYSITYNDFVSGNKTITVDKDPTRNFRYLTLNGTATVLNDIEPAKTEWDLCFTKYSIFFYHPYYIPYHVTGVLNNPSRAQAYLDSVPGQLPIADDVVRSRFDSVTIADFDESRLLTRRDAIGYEWKKYSSLDANGEYTMNKHYFYYIKVDDDKFYKLRFFDFERMGVRGYPSFIYSPL